MKKINTAPISGTEELLPDSQAIFNQLKQHITDSFSLHGFLNIETPILERTEILLAKAGGDTEKQIYRVFKTSETSADSTEALRFDHTVPLARYIAEHESALTFPLKVYQIGENFRGERAQKGRFREFYQCDIDIIGRGSLPVHYDADIIATLIHTYRSFGLSTPVIARISNRKILKGFLAGLNLEEKSKDISNIIDHAEKVPPEKTVSALTEIGLSEENRQKILDFINLSGTKKTVIRGIESLGVSNPLLDEGLSELTTVFELLESSGCADSIIADLKIIRGLDYYTGTVFEFALPAHPEIGSIGGGGRYDNLTGYFTEQKFPGVGGSIGLNRLFYIIREKNLLTNTSARPIDYAIIPLTSNEYSYANEVAASLRQQGHSASIDYTDKKLGARLDHAAKIAKSAIVLGDSEAKSKSYEIKPLN